MTLLYLGNNNEMIHKDAVSSILLGDCTPCRNQNIRDELSIHKKDPNDQELVMNQFDTWRPRSRKLIACKRAAISTE